MNKLFVGLIIGAFLFGTGAIDAQKAHAGYKLFAERQNSDKIDKTKEKIDKTREKFGQKDSDSSNRPEPPKDSNGKPLLPPDRNSDDSNRPEPPKDSNGNPLPPPDRNSDGSNRPEPPKDSNGRPLPPPDRNSEQNDK